MPTYEFRCKDCHEKFDLYYSYQYVGYTLSQCPKCGSFNITQVYYPIGTIYKGDGFYSTDNRKEKEDE